MNHSASAMADGAVDPNAANIVHLTDTQLPTCLRVAKRLRAFIDLVGRGGSWFAMPLILITAFDLLIRKTGVIQLWLVENISPYFGSTLLQELEWHSHTILFTMVLAFGYIWNTQVRVDLVRETLKFRRKAWIEFIGLNIFMIPFAVVITYYAFGYALDSWAANRDAACAWYECGEVSASLVGMSHRWVIKLIMAFGFLMIIVAGITVWLEMYAVLFLPQNWRFPLSTLEWPEEEGATIEGKQRLDLDETPDQLELRVRERQRQGLDNGDA
jgi:TRAP-type mannitol/chloroaromatic compound transport system permease small subunit